MQSRKANSMKMRKIISVLICIMLVFSLCGCANNSGDQIDKPSDANTDSTEDLQPEDSTEPESTDAPDTEPEITTPESEETENTESENTAAPETTPEVITTEEEVTKAPETQTAPTEAPESTAAFNVKAASGVKYANAIANVRSGPETSYKRIGHLDKGDKAEITGICDNGWYRIKFKGSEGYVAGSYLSDKKPEETKPTETTTKATTPKATEAPSTKTPATTPSTTNTPATNPPATNPPATNPPATNPPATTPQATTPPATTPPATTPPETQAPVTTPAPVEPDVPSMSEIVLENHCPSKYTQPMNGVTYAKDWREYSDGRTERSGGESYYSSVCGRNLVLNVVLPQGYNDPANAGKKYPVLYVLHGFFGHRYSMMKDDNCDIVIANAMAAGDAEEMIVVYPDIFASTDPNYLAPYGFDDQTGIAAYDRFVEVIVKDLMPYISKTYRVAEGRENTAVFGFSMGGRESLAIGFTYPDKFGYIAAACPAPGLVPAQDWANNHPGQFKKESDLVFSDENKPYLLLIGGADNDGVVGNFPEQYHKILEKNKTEHLYYLIKDSGHGNPAIQSVCYNFVVNLFKN